MIQFDDLWDHLETFLKFLDIPEMIAQLDDRDCIELLLLVDHEPILFQRVDIALYEKKVGARFDG
jgi:hypothetical protein